MSQDHRPETNLVMIDVHDVREAPGLFGFKAQGCTPLVYTPTKKGRRIHRIVVFAPTRKQRWNKHAHANNQSKHKQAVRV